MSWDLIGNIRGPQGPPGVVAPAGYVMGEAAGGAINGTNKLFSTVQSYLGSSLEVYLNGLRMRRIDDYTEVSGTTFQFVIAPLPGDTISLDYLLPSEAGGTNIYGETPAGLVNGSNKVFTTSFVYSPGLIAIFRSGLRLRNPDDYSETGPKQFTLVDAPLSGDNLSVDYIQP